MDTMIERKRHSDAAGSGDPFFRTRRLFRPYRMGPLDLKNRIAVASFSSPGTAGDGVPTGEMVRHYQSFARGGFGLIVTEGTYTDTIFAQAHAGQPGLVNHTQARGWETLAQAVHICGGKIVLQLSHAGALSQFLPATCAPSAVRPAGCRLPGLGGAGRFNRPASMTGADITKAVSGFVQASLRAEAVGLDGVEIQSGNGYLLDQFLSGSTNRREDEYGGSIIARTRLVVEIIEAIRAYASQNFFIGVRLSQTKLNDPEHRWPGGEADAGIIFQRIADAGADAIHFGSGLRGFRQTCTTPEGVSLPAIAHRTTGLPVIVNGGMHDPVFAAGVLAEGHGNLISLGRGAVANPDWPDRVRTGRPLKPPAWKTSQQDATAEVIPLTHRDKSADPGGEFRSPVKGRI